MMCSYKTILISLTLLGISMSCEDNGLKTKENESKLVIAGNFDTNDYYTLLNPSTLIDEKEVGCFFFSGKDSLDINKDGDFELTFHSNTQVPDMSGECCDCPDDIETICDCWPIGRIYKYIQTFDTLFQIACNDDDRAVCFSINDTVEIWPNWISNDWITMIDIYNFPPPEIVYGDWNLEDYKYLGIRKVGYDTLYGWIKLRLSETIEIQELYLEKE